MVMYYYWSEVEGSVRLNWDIVESGSDQDVIGDYLKNVRNVNI